MNFKALAKKTKKTERLEKTTQIKTDFQFKAAPTCLVFIDLRIYFYIA